MYNMSYFWVFPWDLDHVWFNFLSENRQATDAETNSSELDTSLTEALMPQKSWGSLEFL